ncbi:MAG: NUDIX hydrolase [Candidatus Taylorbacteria bacterium]|nr:NUDIX hydrolase [Candidatus Taylorbacteria bacterium]
MTTRHVSSLILIDKDGKILFQRRTADAKRFAGLLSFFGGGLENNETPEQALVRELKEELDYSVTNATYVGEHPYTLPETQETGIQHVFTELYDPAKTFHLNEGAGIEWHPLDTISTIPLNAIDRGALELYQQKMLS